MAKSFRQNKKIVIVCVIIFFLSLALVFIDILIRPLINLTNLAEKMNNIDNKDPINDLIDELSKLKGSGKINKLITLFLNMR